MIVGLGTDICEIYRIRQAIERHGERFLSRVYTEAEITYCQRRQHPEQGFAARFAAKEAAAKALGTGIAGNISWQDIEVVTADSGQPGVRLLGNAAKRAAYMKVDAMHLSLSHGSDTAVATVILEARSQM